MSISSAPLSSTPLSGQRLGTLAYIFPDADDATGTWTNELGGSTLYASIDEHLAPIDSDFIQSALDPVSDLCRVRLSDPTVGITPTEPFFVVYRYGKFGMAQIDLTVSLKQGTTIIVTYTHTDIAGPPLTVRQTLTTPQFASISDFTNLFLEFTANKV